MTDEQSSNWEYKMICCLGISTSNSDINVVALHKTVKELYEQGRLDEREALSVTKFHLESDLEKTQDLLNECVAREAIRQRGEK